MLAEPQNCSATAYSHARQGIRTDIWQVPFKPIQTDIYVEYMLNPHRNWMLGHEIAAFGCEHLMAQVQRGRVKERLCI